MLCARTLAATLVAATCVLLATADLRPTARQFTGDDLLGKYDLFVRQGKCPATVTHLNYTAVPLDHEGVTYSAYALTHPEIMQQGEACTSSGQFAIVPNLLIDAAGYRDALGETAPVVKDLIAQNAQFLVGVELGRRECGPTYLSANALAIFIEQEMKVRVPGLITLYPGARYMVIYEKDSPTPCTYFQEMPGRTIGELLSPPVIEPLDDGPNAASKAPEGAAAAGGDGSGSGSGAPGIVDPVPPQGASSGDGAGRGTTGADIADTVTSGTGTFPDEDGGALMSPEASPEEDDGGGSVCFHGSTLVTLEGGRGVRIDQLQLGDRVAVAEGVYSPVFMFTHRDAAVRTAFVQLMTASGHSVTLTPGHYLYVDGRLKAARTAKVGDALLLASGASSRITDVRRRTLSGIYNPQTAAGDIVVDGIVASTYTTTVQPVVAHSLLAPLRALYEATGLGAAWNCGAEALAALAPKGAAVYH